MWWLLELRASYELNNFKKFQGKDKDSETNFKIQAALIDSKLLKHF